MKAELKAPPGQFRVVGADVVNCTCWLVGYFDTLDKAIEASDEGKETINKMFIYDDRGRLWDKIKKVFKSKSKPNLGR